MGVACLLWSLRLVLRFRNIVKKIAILRLLLRNHWRLLDKAISKNSLDLQ